jgi:drug/metabolite transporter (DMT)-like permease
VILFGLALAAASTVAINGGYALQHAVASRLPPLSLRAPVRSLVELGRRPRWLTGFLGGIGGWVLYVVALRLAPLSLVQAAAAGGVAVLAVGLGRLPRREAIGVAIAVAGLVLLGLSLGTHTVSTRGDTGDIGTWVVVSVLCAAALASFRTGVALATAAGILYAAGDVATKAAVSGGTRLWFVPVLLACHGLAFVALQLAFQRGRRLATAGVAVLWTNALPIAAGMALFGEASGGPLRLLAFALVLVAALALGATAVPESSPA